MENEDSLSEHAAHLSSILKWEYPTVAKWLYNFPFEERKCIVNYKTENETALFSACMLNNVPLVNFLLDECGAETETKCPYTVVEDKNSVHVVPPIWVASILGQLEVVKTLLVHGANVNGCSDSNSTAVRVACYKNNLELVQYLISQGADINIPNKNGSTCLMNAVTSVELVKCLMENGARIDDKETGNLGLTAVHYAIHNNSIESTKALVEAGADLTITDKDGCFPLISAALFYHMHIVTYLMKEVPHTIEKKITAYELLGSAAVDEDDMNVAVDCWQEGYILKDEHKGLVPVKKMKNHHLVDVGTEPETLSEFQDMPKDHDSLYRLAILIKEKHFGPLHDEYLYTLLMQADKKYKERNWREALDMYKLVHHQFIEKEKWLHDNNIFALASYIRVSVTILERAENDDDKKKLVLDTESMFPVVVNQVKMAMKDLTTENQNEATTAYHHLLCVTLYFIKIVVSTRSDIDRSICSEFFSAARDLARLNPRFKNNDTLLHILVNKRTFLTMDPACDISYTPAMDKKTIATLHVAGLSCTMKGNNGMGVLHTYLCSLEDYDEDDTNDDEDADCFVPFLASLGAHIDTIDASGNSSLDLFRYVCCDLNEMAYRNLRCLAAVCVVKHGIPYQDYIPKSLIPFVELHS